jgi:molybdate transport system regulatory protein
MKIDGRFWLTKDGENFLGSGRIELLEQIERTGSMHAAAKAMKMSYKAAWERINQMNRVAEQPIITKSTGGKGGGGSQLTPHAYELIATFRRFEELHRQFIERFAEAGDDPERLARILSRTFLTTSARNQLEAKVLAIDFHGLRGVITLDLGKGDVIKADITQKSIRSMGLDVGCDAYAIIKSSDVVLSLEIPYCAEHQNLLKGFITTVERSDESAEVTIMLESGKKIVGIVKDHEDFIVAQTVYILIDCGHVILGL